MSMGLFLMLIALVSVAFVGCNIYINSAYAIGRSTVEKLVLALLVVVMVSSGYFGVSGYWAETGNYCRNIYLAYKYLTVGDYTEALKKVRLAGADPLTDIEGAQINILAKGFGGNQNEAENVATTFLLQNPSLAGAAKQKIEQLVAISRLGQGLVDKASQKLLGTQRVQRLPQEPAQREAEIEQLYREYTEQSITRVQPDKGTSQVLDTIISLDSRLKKGEDTSGLRGEIDLLASTNRDDLDVMKLQARVDVATGDFAAAKDALKQIVIREGNSENKIALTDAIAQETRQYLNTGDYNNAPSTVDGADSELQAINQTLQTRNTEVAELQNREDSATDTLQKYRIRLEREAKQKEIADLQKGRAILPIQRSINYLISSHPIVGGDALSYYLQLAKLYFAADDKTKAKDYWKKAFQSRELLNTESTLQDDLDAVKRIYEQNPYTVDEPQLVPKVTELVNDLDQGFIPPANNNLNEEFKNFVVSDLKYSKIDMFISRVDTSRYPQITAYANVGTDKYGFWGNPELYSDKDFAVEDTQVPIGNFKVTKNRDRSINICLVFDKSGSMTGRPIEDSKLAGVNFVHNLGPDDRTSIVSFDTNATRGSELTDAKALLENTVNSLGADGGTNIAGGLDLGLETVRYATGGKAIILLSDGVDENAVPGAIDKSLAELRKLGIPVYTIGLGDADDDYLGNLAEITGGKFIKATNSTELLDIYPVLQKYIVNNYVFNYTVEKNKEVDERNVTVTLNSTNSQGNKDYRLGIPTLQPVDAGDEVPSFGELTDTQFLLTGIVNSSICSKQVLNNVYIEIHGQNFSEGVRVKFGSRPSPEVKLVSSILLKAKLPVDMKLGEYNVIGINSEGRVSTIEDGLSIYAPGALNELKVGNLTIKANTIDSIGNNEYLAHGNVRINDVLRAAGKLKVTAQNDYSAQEKTYSAGDVQGSCKLFVSFNGQPDSFANKVLGGRELLVSDGDFVISATVSNTVLKRSSLLDLDFGKFKLTLGSFAVVPDGVELTALKFGFANPFAKKEGEGGSTTHSPSRIKLFPFESEIKFMVTAEDVKCKIAVKLGASEQFRVPVLSFIKPSELFFTLDTIEEKKLEFGGKIDVKFAKYFEGFELKYSGFNYNPLIPDCIDVSLKCEISLHPSKLARLKSLGLGGEKIYRALGIRDDAKTLASQPVDWHGVYISGTGDITVGLDPTKMAILKKLKLADKLKLDEVVAFSDLKAKTRLSIKDLDLELSGKVKIFDSEMAEAKIKINKDTPLEARFKAEIKQDFWLAAFGLKGEDLLSFSGNSLLLEQIGDVWFRTRWSPTYSGSGWSRTTINNQAITFVISAKVNQMEKSFRLAVGLEGNLLNILDRIHVEMS